MTTILVVDDEPKIAQLARDYLEHAGFRVMTAAEGRDFDTLTISYKAPLYDTGVPDRDGQRRSFSGKPEQIAGDIRSFAEIGVGQEVARWFLRVGAASGTVAKTVSAYDKIVSDDLYGSGTRYVSRPRLETMLDSSFCHEVEKT